jgi:aromatic-amino-acid transaminase
VEFLIPSHTSRPGDDPIFALNTEARARKARGESVVNATVGALLDDDGKLAVLPSLGAALREVPLSVAAAYAPIAGPAELLRVVSIDAFGEARAPLCAAAATPGGTGALRHAIANFVEPGQSVLTTSFYWGPYRTLTDELDRTLTTFPMFDAAGRFDVAGLERALAGELERQGRALLLLNSPCHNPTGYSLDEREWADVVRALDAASRRGPVTVLLDAAYAHYGQKPVATAVDALASLSERVLVLFAWSASKSFTFYGGRVGALVALVPDAGERARVDAALSYSCRGTWSNCNAAGMAAVTRLLGELAPEAQRERAALTALLGARVARWNELARPAGLTYPRYDGGFFTTVLTPAAHEVAAAMKADGVFVVPQAGALRVALCSVAERDVERVVASVARHLPR